MEPRGMSRWKYLTAMCFPKRLVTPSRWTATLPFVFSGASGLAKSVCDCWRLR